MRLKWSIVHRQVLVEFISKELGLRLPLPLECHVLAALVVCLVTFLWEILRIVSAGLALDFAPCVIEVRSS